MINKIGVVKHFKILQTVMMRRRIVTFCYMMGIVVTEEGGDHTGFVVVNKFQ